MFSSDEEKETPDDDSTCSTATATVGTNPTLGTDKDFDLNGLVADGDGHKVNKYLY